MRYTHPTLIEHLASAHVLGTLRGGARRRFERLLNNRADIRQHVALWEARLGQLAISVPPQRPSAQVWDTINARTRPDRAGASALLAPAQTGRGWGWRVPAGFGLGGFAIGALALSAVLFSAPLLFLSTDQLAMRAGEKLPQSYVGLLTDAQGNGKLLVSSLRHGKTLTIKVIGPIAPVAQGRLVLWAIVPNGPALALGSVPVSGVAVSLLPDTSEKLLSKVSKLVVTLETVSSPASPSADVVFSGNCAKLW